jgi:site-specific DNA recombinase
MGMAQREVDVLAQRTRDGMEAKLRAGGWPQKAPHGYLNKERLVSSNKYDRWVELDLDYAPVFREAWDLLLTGGYTLEQICEELTKRGYTRVSGRPWAWDDPKSGTRKYAGNQLHKVFHNPFYAGWVASKRFGIKMGEVRGRWEPIVTTEEFGKGLEVLHKHDDQKSRRKKHFYLLRNLLWVEAAGRQYKMYVSTPSGKTKSYSYYITHSKPNGSKIHIPCEVIEEQVPGWMRGISVDPQLIPQIQKIYQKQVRVVIDGDKDTQIVVIKRRLSLFQDEEARLGRLFITGNMSEETYKQLRAEWEVKLKQVEINLASIERESKISLDDLDVALALMVKLPDLYMRLKQEQQANLLQIIIKRIIVDGDGEITDIELKSPFLYLRSIVTGIYSREQGSDQISVGAQIEPLDISNDIERFLSLIRFEQRGNLEELKLDV